MPPSHLDGSPRATTLHLRQMGLHLPPQLSVEEWWASLKKICLCCEEVGRVWKGRGHLLEGSAEMGTEIWGPQGPVSLLRTRLSPLLGGLSPLVGGRPPGLIWERRLWLG